jgi:hypothetical protein
LFGFSYRFIEGSAAGYPAGSVSARRYAEAV